LHRALGRAGRHWIAMSTFRDAKKDLVKFIADHFKANPHTLSATAVELRKFRRVGDDVWEALVDELSKEKTVEVVRNEIRYLKGELALSPHQAALLEKIYAAFVAGKFQPPTLEDVVKSWDLPHAEAEKVMGMLVAQRRVKRVAENIYFSQQNYDAARGYVIDTIDREGKLTSNGFRDWAGSSRKWVIPLLEYFDKIGLTRRIENDRSLRNRDAQ
jgi:selenocysteine-specific elongation factor